MKLWTAIPHVARGVQPQLLLVEQVGQAFYLQGDDTPVSAKDLLNSKVSLLEVVAFIPGAAHRPYSQTLN